jgi:hypothetical protein
MSLSNPTCGQRRLFIASVDSARCAEMYLAGMNPKEIGHELCHTAETRVTEALRQAGVWKVPIFKAQHRAARKKRQPVAGAVQSVPTTSPLPLKKMG